MRLRPTRKAAWLGPRTEALLYNASAFVAGTAVSQVVLTVALIYTARHLGIAAFGQYSAVFALIGILSAFASYGLDTWLLREGGRAPERLPELIGDLLVVKLILAIVWSSSIALISSVVQLPVFPSRIVRIGLVWGVGETFSLLAYAAFRAKLQHKVAAMLQAFNSSLLLLLTIVLANNHAQLIDLVWARSLVSLAGVVVSWSIAAKVIGIRFHRPHVAAYLRSASPFAASDFLTGLYLKADVTLVAFYLGPAAAGIYAPAVAILNTLFVVPNAAYMVMLPTLSNLHRTEDALLRIAARRMQTGVGFRRVDNNDRVGVVRATVDLAAVRIGLRCFRHSSSDPERDLVFQIVEFWTGRSFDGRGSTGAPRCRSMHIRSNQCWTKPGFNSAIRPYRRCGGLCYQ